VVEMMVAMIYIARSRWSLGNVLLSFLMFVFSSERYIFYFQNYTLSMLFCVKMFFVFNPLLNFVLILGHVGSKT
jgi:hypothetical protein